jgi:hypothetical protein
MDQAEQYVLSPDVVVVEESCLLLREDHDPPGSVGEALEQNLPPLVRFLDIRLLRGSRNGSLLYPYPRTAKPADAGLCTILSADPAASLATRPP